MSSFFIQPKKVLDKTVCCSAAGVSDAVTAEDISENSNWGNYRPLKISDPNVWKLLDTPGSSVMEVRSALGFGVCCTPKTFTVKYELFFDITSSTKDNWDVSASAFSSILGLVKVTVTRLTFLDDAYQRIYTEIGDTVNDTGFVQVLSPEDLHFTYTVSGLFVPSVCNGEVTIFSNVIQYSSADPYGAQQPGDIPVRVFADISIT